MQSNCEVKATNGLKFIKQLKNKWVCFLAALLSILAFSACSTQKNTWGSRHYHDLTTRYNVYFNGNESYKQGIKQLNDALKEDYSKLLPLYPVNIHSNAKGTASNMDQSIEKCQKAIKKHSIRVKPAKRPNAKSSREYKIFYSKEEFNPFMGHVFLLMANSQFHKADFLSATSTCSYIIGHFATDKVLCDKASILMARAYTEMNWYYEAENIFNNLNKGNLTPALTSAFSGAYADLFIHRKRYAEAIPYMEIAVEKTHHKMEKARWNFLLAQLYQETGKRENAYKLFSAIPGMNPPYEMELSARIRQTEVYLGNSTKNPLNKLLKLSRSNKNLDYLDQIYYAMGNLYFASRDTAKAVESYRLAIEKSTQNSPHKLKTLLALGEYYYNTHQFIQAGPCYFNALTLLNKEDENYTQISQRADILKALVPNLKTIHDEDSLQTIANIPEKERMETISKLIKIAEKKAKEDATKKGLEETLNANAEMPENKARIPQATPATSFLNDGNWYFYNPSTVSKGLTDFQQKWGKRSLKDDWRRNNKTALFENMEALAISSDSTKIKSGKDSKEIKTADSTRNEVLNFTKGADDPLNPNFYLRNLPFTKEQINASNEKIAKALYEAAFVYREQMENDQLALETFRELEFRFPKSLYLENAWYITYLMLKQQKRDSEAEIDRKKQITIFPESPLAKRLKDSIFIEKLIKMYQVQDTLYAHTYQLYLLHRTDSVFITTHDVEENYPASPLIPKFAFLEAMESARTGKPDEFHRLLTYINHNYPKSDLDTTVRQMLAYWDKGLRPVPSAAYTNLQSTDRTLEQDSTAKLDSLSREFKFNPSEEHVLLISYPNDSTNVDKLQFDVALYNFTNFLIRDYDLSFAKVGQINVLLIRSFENAEDAIRYRSWIMFQNEKPEDKYPGIHFIIVSNSNLRLLEEGVSSEAYQKFYEKNYAGIKPKH